MISHPVWYMYIVYWLKVQCTRLTHSKVYFAHFELCIIFVPNTLQVPDVLTTSQGHPVDSKTSTLTVGERGPVVIQDFTFIDEMAHFDRERIPERVVHAKGAGKC